MGPSCGRRTVLLAAPLGALLVAVFSPPADALSWRRIERENRATTVVPTGINMADCQGNETWTLTYARGSETGDIEAWVGVDCDVQENRTTSINCYRLWGPEAILDSKTFAVSAQVLVEPELLDDPTLETCVEGEGANQIWLLMLDSTDSTVLAQLNHQVEYDTERPPAPTDLTVEFGETRASLAWKAESETVSAEWDGFRILCHPAPGTGGADADADAGADTGGDTAADTTSDGIADAGSDSASDATSDADAGYVCSTACPFAEGDEPLDEWYCSGEIGGDQRSRWVEDLTNGTEYHFAVVALDDYDNPSLVSEVVCTVPSEINDFWETYEDAGGQAEGGCACRAAGAGGGPAALAALLLGAWLAVRRRRRGRGGPGEVSG